jgi:hypothetical protein
MKPVLLSILLLASAACAANHYLTRIEQLSGQYDSIADTVTGKFVSAPTQFYKYDSMVTYITTHDFPSWEIPEGEKVLSQGEKFYPGFGLSAYDLVLFGPAGTVQDGRDPFGQPKATFHYGSDGVITAEYLYQPNSSSLTPNKVRTFTFFPNGYLNEVHCYYVHDYSGATDSISYAEWEEYPYNSYDQKGRLTRMVKQGQYPQIWGFRYFGDTLIVTTFAQAPYRGALEYRAHYSSTPITSVNVPTNLGAKPRAVPRRSFSATFSLSGRIVPSGTEVRRTGIYLRAGSAGKMEKVMVTNEK